MPKVRSELEEMKSGTKYICSNEDCDFSISKKDMNIQNLRGTTREIPWHSAVCMKEELWFKEALLEKPLSLGERHLGT